MKTVALAAAAAMLLSVAQASASTTKIIVSLLGQSCHLTVNSATDKSDGVTKKVLLAGSASDCAFIGAGVVGKTGFARGDTKNVATITGDSGFTGSTVITVIFDYPFVTNGAYSAYETSNGTSLTHVVSGNYQVQ
jgi:hypothetical protein